MAAGGATAAACVTGVSVGSARGASRVQPASMIVTASAERFVRFMVHAYHALRYSKVAGRNSIPTPNDSPSTPFFVTSGASNDCAMVFVSTSSSDTSQSLLSSK